MSYIKGKKILDTTDDNRIYKKVNNNSYIDCWEFCRIWCKNCSKCIWNRRTVQRTWKKHRYHQWK